MEAAFAEMPLALFSTLAPLGAGAFVALAAAFLAADLSDDQLKKIDKMTAIPVVLVLAGFVAAFFHLASPLNAFGVFAGVGTSPLSNEVAVGCVFVVLMLAYWIWALTGKMGRGARKGMAVVVAVAALVFAAFTGLAYLMDTIASWNTPAVPLQMMGYCLAGGAAAGVLVLGLAGCGEALGTSPLKVTLIVLAIAGAVIGIGAAAMQLSAASGMATPFYAGGDLVDGVMMTFVLGAVCLAASAVCTVLAVRGKSAAALGGAATVLAFVGILCLRLAFYGIQLSVGLALLP
ncbi:MAG: dimethyl sulfoxide reductase anchor subunit [Eggerthellaceae bacterium]|nr:dimethyl sulfoxide reductase anchor subunit [Eggerthellaceae bacterium]